MESNVRKFSKYCGPTNSYFITLSGGELLADSFQKHANVSSRSPGILGALSTKASNFLSIVNDSVGYFVSAKNVNTDNVHILRFYFAIFLSSFC